MNLCKTYGLSIFLSTPSARRATGNVWRRLPAR